MNVANMVTRIKESKTLDNIFHTIIHVNLMAQNVIQLKTGIKNCDVID